MTKAVVKERAPAPLFGEVEPPAKQKAEVVAVAPKAKKKIGTAVAVHNPSPPKSVIELCLEAARDSKTDPARIREFLAIAREEENAVKERMFYESIGHVKDELPIIIADSPNTHTKSKWAKYEKVSKIADPIIRKHGFCLTEGMSDSPLDEHYRVICDVANHGFVKRYYLDGPSDAVGAKGGGTKTPIQGVGSTITYLQRRLKMLIFDIVVAGEDTDGSGQPQTAISAELAKDLRAKLTAANITDDQFCGVYKIETVEQLPASKLANALDRIAQKQRTTS